MVQVFFGRRKVFGQASSVSTQTDKAELRACCTVSLVSPGIVRDASGREKRRKERAPLAVVAAMFAGVAVATADDRLAVIRKPVSMRAERRL
jgi:hypothetical protein